MNLKCQLLPLKTKKGNLIFPFMRNAVMQFQDNVFQCQHASLKWFRMPEVIICLGLCYKGSCCMLYSQRLQLFVDIS